jgi:outer membrane receptor for ferrienterochelin and colicin
MPWCITGYNTIVSLHAKNKHAYMRSITVKLLCFLLALTALVKVQAQVTTSSMSGTVKDGKGQALVGATVSLTHNPTGTVYTSVSRNGGTFDIPNIRAGGPYKLEITFVGYDKLTRNDIFVNLGETSTQDINMEEKSSELTEVVISASRTNKEGAKGGAGTDIGRDKMNNLPTVGRNVADYLRYVPQAKVTVDGGVSLAGQNNRYNSFYIDGAANNDVFGLSASGTNGGQAGIAPISIDAIDQFQVVISPYDASLGNFTGGGINAITRSGTNNVEGSIYHFWRNEKLSGKTPGVPKDNRIRLADFKNQTTGVRIAGPIIENKLFFFLNAELQRDTRPQPFDFSTYDGNSTQADLDNLANFLRSEYGYEPGGYLDNAEKVEADRIVGKIDWNINDVHKLSASYRYNKGLRYNTSRSSNSTINFYNNGYLFPTLTHSGSLELNSRFKRNSNNRLLLTFTSVEDDRGPIGDAFPRVRINDGAGSIMFGTEEFSTGNLLEQNNYALFDVYKFYLGKHTLSVGTDDEISTSTNVFIRQNFGSYVFNDLNTFLTGGTASTYDRTYSLVDPPKTTGDNSVNAAAKFTTLRLGFFINDEIKFSDEFTLSLGLRLDNTNFITTPKTDQFFNDTAIAAISQHYDLKGARSGQISDPKWSLNPRVGFVYRVRDEKITVRGGVGFFTGRVPLVWPGGVYNNNGISLAGIRSSNVEFREDPFNQYEASDFGINVPIPSGQVDLVAKDFKMNKVFRTSLAMDKEFGAGWRFSVEGIYTKNINEIDYKQVNILPATRKSNGPDVRNVYDLSGSFPLNIPMRSNGTNPYTGVYLLSNNEGPKGYAYSFTFTVDKRWSKGWAFNANYTYGNSIVLNEGTSSQNNSQWRFMETVNGRNFMQLSTSDYDIGHRFNAYAAKKFTYARGMVATTISLVYNGQSGNPYSYVLNRGMVRDVDNNETNDLLYIPTATELQSMIFLSNTVGSTTYTPQQQRDLFETFIQNDKYLRKHRGEYAERNGARLPFSNIIDLKIQQDFNLKMFGKTVQVQVTYDVFNFTNMLNNDWGKIYFISNDQSPIVEMASFVSNADLTPRYRFTPPASGKPYVLSDGVFNSARWSSQLGVRLSVF